MSKVIPSGYSAIFHMNTTPVGWTKDTVNYNNSALRVVTGSTSTGGTLDFSSVFVTSVDIPITVVGNSSAVVISSRTLIQSELPAHTHTTNGAIASTTSSYTRSPENSTALNRFTTEVRQTSNTFTSNPVAHTHSLGTLLSGLTSSSINLNMNVKYVDVIRATRD